MTLAGISTATTLSGMSESTKLKAPTTKFSAMVKSEMTRLPFPLAVLVETQFTQNRSKQKWVKETEVGRLRNRRAAFRKPQGPE
jgi:hypothetical protein